eukprot:621129-Pyramimonas_sp.AAC.1
MGRFDIAGGAHDDELRISPLGDEKDGRLKFNWDSGAAICAFPRSFAPEGLTGNGAACKTASGRRSMRRAQSERRSRSRWRRRP